MSKLSDIDLRKTIPEGSKVVVGLSGGADSIALLDLLHKQGFQCFAAHCNFHLRCEESNRDFKFAHSWCSEQKIPFFYIDFYTSEYAAFKRISTEMAARELRYNWFAELKDRVKADCIAVAHHADDCIETFLINMSRGTGLRGLSGIKEWQGSIVRPLLHYTKKEILDYIHENNLSYVDDSTNFESVYTRNKFRNQIIPLLEEVNPTFRRNILLTMSNLLETEQFVNHQLDQFRNAYIHPLDEGGFALAKEPILQSADSHFILFEMIRIYGFSSDVASDLIRLGMDGTGKHFFSDQYELRCERNEWEIRPIQKNKEEKYLIQSMNDVDLLPVKLRIRRVTTENLALKRDPNVCYADCDKISFPLTLRHCQSGDYFVPFGMTGRKKTSDFFIDQHYSQFDKDKIWILTGVNGDVIWLVGKRADNRCRITEKTQWVYEFTLEK